MSEEEIQEAIDLLARHAALLERATVLERALEKIHDGCAEHPRYSEDPVRFEGPMTVAEVARRALDG